MIKNKNPKLIRSKIETDLPTASQAEYYLSKHIDLNEIDHTNFNTVNTPYIDTTEQQLAQLKEYMIRYPEPAIIHKQTVLPMSEALMDKKTILAGFEIQNRDGQNIKEHAYHAKSLHNAVYAVTHRQMGSHVQLDENELPQFETMVRNWFLDLLPKFQENFNPTSASEYISNQSQWTE